MQYAGQEGRGHRPNALYLPFVGSFNLIRSNFHALHGVHQYLMLRLGGDRIQRRFRCFMRLSFGAQ